MGRPEIDAVREWLLREGYPLEYETAREMARTGYQVSQGLYYEDPETSQRREVDVTADEPESPNSPWRPVRVVVECKNNSKPWLALARSRTFDRGVGTHLLISNVPMQERQFLHAASSRADFVLNVPERHAYSVVQAIAGPDIAHAALQAVSKAAYSSIQPFGPDQPAIAIPVVVLGGSLYQLAFRDDGSEVLEPVVWMRVVWHGSGVLESPIQVDIVTREHLPQYLNALRAATRSLAGVLDGFHPGGAG